MKEKILIVEDDKKISRLIELLLFHEGYEVTPVYDGKEGFGKIKYDRFDLVLLDVMIPGMNGIEVCRKVREFSDIPILDVYIKYLRDKIEKPFNKKYIHTIRGIGFTLKK